MGKLVLQTLGFSTELLSELSSRFGSSQTMSRQVVSQLKPSGTIAKAFLPKAKNPNVKWGYNKDTSSQTINFTFRDGEAARTSGSFTASEQGRIDYDFNFVNPKTGEQTISTRGFYDPNKPLFSKKEFGLGCSRDHSQYTVHTHSSGFSNDTTTNEEYIRDTAKQIKDFFSNVFGRKERVGRMFFPEEVPV